MEGRPDLGAWRRRVRARCWLLYRGLDAHLIGPRDPTPWVVDLPVVAREIFAGRGPGLTGLRVHLAPEIRLELREIVQ